MPAAKRPVALVLGLGILALSSAASADPPAKKDPVFKAFTVRATACDSDGGSSPCSSGVKYLGEILGKGYTNDFADNARTCAGVKPGKYTFRFGFEYNDGAMFIEKEEKLSPCVLAFAHEAVARYLANWHVVRPIDPTVDVRSHYEATITLK
jgi:hypothetical protein